MKNGRDREKKRMNKKSNKKGYHIWKGWLRKKKFAEKTQISMGQIYLSPFRHKVDERWQAGDEREEKLSTLQWFNMTRDYIVQVHDSSNIINFILGHMPHATSTPFNT